MSTLPIHFKLAKPGHSTRKVSFEENPSWMLLAHKAEELFRVPMEHLGLVYSDDEGDKITLSSQDELAEFYATARPPYKFVVKDLSSSQDPSVVDDDFLSRAYSALPTGTGDRPRPPASPFNLGGIPLTFEVMDDGFPIEILQAHANAGKAGSTAYVEELGTASRRSTPASKAPDGKDKDLDNKGKGRMQPSVADFEDLGDAAELVSHASMDGSFRAGGDADKPPVHVFDAKHDTTVRIEEQKEDPASFLQRVLDLGRREREDGGAPDPPLAPIEDKPKAPPPPSLVKDLADVMQQLALTTATQPELTESIRGMLRNVADGAYWANDASRQLPNETDEARAGMRLADSLGDLFKALGAGVAREVATALENGTPGPARPRSPPRERRGWDRVRDRMFPNGIPRPPYPPYGPPPPPPRGFGGRPFAYPPSGPPPPPPPPGAPRYPIAPPPPGERFDIWNPRNFPMLRRAQTYPAAPAPPPPPAPVPPVRTQPTIQFAPPPQIPPRPTLEVARPVQPMQPMQPMQPVAPVPSAPVSLDDRRVTLEATKQAYIEAKEAYRREKEERRREKERLLRERTGFSALPTGNTSGASTPAAPPPQEVKEREETHPFTPRHTTRAQDIPEVPPPPMQPVDIFAPDPDVSAQYTLERAPADVKPERTFTKMAYSPAQFRAAFASPLPPPGKPISPAARAPEGNNPFARSPANAFARGPGSAFPRSPGAAGNAFARSPGAAGTAFARSAGVVGDAFARSPGPATAATTPTTRIIARLADMGFNETNHPDLQSRVARHLRANVHPTTEAEDAIVVRLLEELIANTAGSSKPQAMPGAFA